MRILFITRKHPPSSGGMENLSYHLTESISKAAECHKIAWRGSQKWLPFFLISAFIKACAHCRKRNIDIIHIGDPVLSVIGVALKKIFNIPVAVTCHGLDLTYPNQLYQKYLDLFLGKMDKYICISTYAQRIACKRVPSSKTIVIPVGVNSSFSFTDKKFGKRKLLLTVGRLVKRKGVLVFLKDVFPNLRKSYEYVIVGKGPERSIIAEHIKQNGLQNRVRLITNADDETLKKIYKAADIFIMPNITVKNDVEGFGLVALEAAATGLPVIATRVDGITDAIIDGKNGYLVNEGVPAEMKQKIESIKLARNRKFSDFTRRKYSWNTIAKQYINAFKTCL